jgi:hypothetical protein
VAWAKVPQEYRGVKIGMDRSEVIRVLETTPGHLAYQDLGAKLGEVIRGDKLFRHALYSFDGSNKLVEIALEMREILGADQVLTVFNKEHGLSLAPHKSSVEGDHAVEVRGNKLVIRRVSNLDNRAAGSSR